MDKLNHCIDCNVKPTIGSTGWLVIYNHVYCPKCGKTATGLIYSDAVRRWNEGNPTDGQTPNTDLLTYEFSLA